jgi:hypothetical protein
MASTLRRWLQKAPRPDIIVGLDPDGEERKVKIGVLRSKWSDAENALAGCSHADALDHLGNVLRSCELDGAPPASEAAPGAARGELVELARLLNEAHDAGATRHGDAYRLAYEQQCKLVEILTTRNQALEKAWHQLMMAQERPDEVDPNAGMVQALLGGAFSMGAAPPAQAAPPAAPTPPTNGKKARA